MVNTGPLPLELRAEMGRPIKRTNKDAHTLTLSYCEHNGPATVDELLVYIWAVTGEVKSRGYMYHVLKRLRDRGHLARIDLESETVVRHMITDNGLAHLEEVGAKYVKPRKKGDDDE